MSTPEALREITDAVTASPSVHNTRPWELEFHQNRVELHERPDALVPRHDPIGRDRLISCGSAAATLDLAVRHRGLTTALWLLPDEGRPGLLARIDIVGQSRPSARDEELYAAISRRHSYRRPFSSAQVDPEIRERLLHPVDDEVAGVEVRPIAGDGASKALARWYEYAALALRADTAYQRELGAWSGQLEGGLPLPAPESDSLPWALVRPTTHIPDEETLAERLRTEVLLVVLTADDARLDHLRAGVAAQHTWLAAVAAGLVGSVHTQALHLSEVRSGLIEQLELAGFPQMIMRFGLPAPAGSAQN